MPASEHERLRAAAREAIREAVVPAYRGLLEFFTGQYLPGARTTIGASEQPEGKAYYAWLVKDFTTLDITLEEVHRIGLAETERIRREMYEVVRQVRFQGSFAEFLEFLRTDPRFYAKTPDELLKQAAWIAKRMDGKLPPLFGRLPRQPYGVEPVPADLAPKYTGARTTTGASELPDGRAYYAWLVKDYTTLDTTPEAVHRIGLGEVQRIHREMDEVVRKTGFHGSFVWKGREKSI